MMSFRIQISKFRRWRGLVVAPLTQSGKARSPLNLNSEKMCSNSRPPATSKQHAKQQSHSHSHIAELFARQCARASCLRRVPVKWSGPCGSWFLGFLKYGWPISLSFRVHVFHFPSTRDIDIKYCHCCHLALPLISTSPVCVSFHVICVRLHI